MTASAGDGRSADHLLTRAGLGRLPRRPVSRCDAGCHAVDRTLPISGDRRFEHGQDTAGYEDVRLPTRHTPKFVTGPNGEQIDIGHVYAAPRCDLDRGGDRSARRDFMRWANTHGEDSWQEYLHGAERWWEQGGLPRGASEYAPPDQRRGSTVGPPTDA